MRSTSAKLKAAELSLQSAEHSLTSAKMAALPDFQFSLGLNQYHSQSALSWYDLERDYTFGISVTIPLFFLLNELPGVEAAHRDTDVARANVERITLDSAMIVSSLARQYASLTSQSDNLRTHVIPAARSAYQLSIKAMPSAKRIT